MAPSRQGQRQNSCKQLVANPRRGTRPAESADAADEAAGLLLLEDLGMIQGQPGERAFARGVGWRLHRVLLRTVYQPWRSEEFLDRAPDALRAAVREGYEEAVVGGRLKIEP